MQTLNRHDSAAGAESASRRTGEPSSLGDCFDGFFWKIIKDFCWSYKDRLSWEDFYNHINVKIVNFPYSQNVMNMLYNFITEKTDLLHFRLFPDFIKSQTSNHFGDGALGANRSVSFAGNIDFVLIMSILEEITSLGKDHYEAATVDLVYNMYIYDKYTIPGGLCRIFTTFNNTKTLRCEHIPNAADFASAACVASDSEAEPE